VRILVGRASCRDIEYPEKVICDINDHKTTTTTVSKTETCTKTGRTPIATITDIITLVCAIHSDAL
jgi:hypothetical protein